VLAAARGVPGARKDGRWRCVVYLSAYDWMSGWLRVPDMAAQLAACKAWLSAHGDARKAETIRNCYAVRNVRAAFDELMQIRYAPCSFWDSITKLQLVNRSPNYVPQRLSNGGRRPERMLLVNRAVGENR
jgi:hypothetical protein